MTYTNTNSGINRSINETIDDLIQQIKYELHKYNIGISDVEKEDNGNIYQFHLQLDLSNTQNITSAHGKWITIYTNVSYDNRPDIWDHPKFYIFDETDGFYPYFEDKHKDSSDDRCTVQEVINSFVTRIVFNPSNLSRCINHEYECLPSFSDTPKDGYNI